MVDSAPSTTSSSPRIPALSDLTLSSPNPSPSLSTYSSFLDPFHPPPRRSTSSDPSSNPPEFEFGQAVFERRRAAWKQTRAPAIPEPAELPSDGGGGGGSMQRLEDLLSGPRGSDVGEEAWRSGLEGVHRGLLGGRRLVKRMKLGLVIKVLRAGWIRDGTWPASLPPVPPSPPYLSSDLPPSHAQDSTTTTTSSTPSGYHQPFAVPSSSTTPTNNNPPQSPPTSIVLPPPPRRFQSTGSATSAPSQTTTTPGTDLSTPGFEDVPASPLTPVAEGEVEAEATAEAEKKAKEEEEGTATEHQEEQGQVGLGI